MFYQVKECSVCGKSIWGESEKSHRMAMGDCYFKMKRHREEHENEQEKIKLAKEEGEKEKQRKRQKEAEKLDKIYNSLDPLQQKEIKKEVEERLFPFMKDRLKEELKKGEISELTIAALKSKEREVVRDWLVSGKIKSKKATV